MSANGDSVEAKLADLDVKDSAVAEDREKDVSTSSQSAGEQKVIAKFLMSNPAAGSIIGKGGANISELQSQSGARLQLSRANEFFPGTQDRVMLASGSVNQVLTALHLIWTKIQGEQAVAETMMARDGKSPQLRLLVPTPLCGSIIGKGGATIRSFAEDSQAAITVSPQEKQPLGLPDRVVKITGTPDQLLRAVALLLTKLVESPNYTRFTTSNVSYGPPLAPMPNSYGPMGYGMPSGGPAMQMPPAMAFPKGNASFMPPQQQRMEVTVPVPEARVGAIIGKGGEVISQLKSVIGVKIRISDRDDFVPGTRNRKVTISGAADAVQIAQVLIHQKINQAAAM
ncbi:g12948 [Coccomyxa viridis]|uniref:G12948 protein n=1 Tax=Coccomyxa viridis TaxID=1274662 RepID=A0ABP1GE85_9CHLO